METTIIIVSFCSILLLGLGHIIYDVCIISHRVSDIKTFLNVLNAFIIKYRDNKDNTCEVNHIMAFGEDLSKYMNEYIYNSPIICIQSMIRNSNTYNIENEVSKVFRNAPAALRQLSIAKRNTLLQLANPFIWFYCGIEVLSFIVLGYFVNTGSIEYRGKAWNTFNIFFSLITGIATLVGFYLQITGQTP